MVWFQISMLAAGEVFVCNMMGTEVSGGGGFGVIEMFHSPLVIFCLPVMMIFPFFTMWA